MLINKVRIVLLTLVGVSLSLLGGYSSSDGQILNSGFGKNKVHYKVFKWATLETEHFTIYFYHGEEQLARNTEKMAERAYQYLASVLQHQFAHKIPLIIYASSDDFQQTEIIPGFLDEGIGGVTESLRGRIIIPFLGSYRSFNHVLVHELVHGFQFDILSGGQQGVGTSLLNIYLPLWFVEGMAEYLSEYTNPLTDMWLQDAVYYETLPEADRLERMQDIRVYRFGQSIWQYISETYGNKITGDLLRGLAEGEKWEQIIQTAAHTTWTAIYNRWRQRIQETYRSDAPGQHPIHEQASVLIPHEDKKFSLNIIPAISPDGKYVAFISDRDFYRTIYLASAETGEIISKLVEGERLGTFETLRFLNTSITWAPDNQHIAFNAKGGGENAIYLLNIHTRKIIKTLVPQVSSLSFIAWSPDDTVIAFTGTKHGQEDLFLIDISTAETIQLTNDLYSNRHPSWSPTGKAIAFSTDAGQFSDLSELKFGPSNLAVYEIASGASYLLSDTPANDFTPVWSPDETVIAFISDMNGLCNLYLLQLKKNIRQKRMYSVEDTRILTNVNTGVVGLTEDNPALTWAKESGKLLFSGFSKRGWDIFTIGNPLKQYQEYLAESGFEEEERSGQWTRVSSETIGKKDWGYTLPLREELSEVKDYSAHLSPEYILLGGGGNVRGLYASRTIRV